MKLAFAVTRLIKGTDKIDGIVVIVPDRDDAHKVAENLSKMKMETYSYGVLEAAYYTGDINEAIPAP